MDEHTELLHLLADRLEALEIPYMVSGSVALNVYAEPRMTRDTDVVIALHRPRVDDFVAAFAPDFYCDRSMVVEAVARSDMFNVIHNTWIAKVDFIIQKDSPYRHEEFERRRMMPIEGREVSIVAPEDLLLSKLVWSGGQSELQLRDVRGLIRHVEIDWAYVDRWADGLGVAKLVQAIRKGPADDQ